MPFPKEALNELKWREDRDLSQAEIWFIHRGAPNDTKVVSGGDILKLGRSFMIVDEASIPYHRIFRIIYQGKVIFERKN